MLKGPTQLDERVLVDVGTIQGSFGTLLNRLTKSFAFYARSGKWRRKQIMKPMGIERFELDS